GRRVAKGLDLTFDFEALCAIHSAGEGEITQIDFISAARKAHRERPYLSALRPQQRDNTGGFAAIFVAVGEQENLALTTVVRLCERRLQRGLDIGLFAV